MFLCGWGGLCRSKVKNPFWQKSHISAQNPQFLEWLSKKERWSFSSVLSAVLPWFKDMQWFGKLVHSCMKKRWRFLHADNDDCQFISHIYFSVTPCWCNEAQWGCRLLKTVAEKKKAVQILDQSEVFSTTSPTPKVPVLMGTTSTRAGSFGGLKRGS